MIKVGKWIAKHKILIIIIGIVMKSTGFVPKDAGAVWDGSLFHDSGGGYGTEGCSCSERENRSS